MYAKWRVTLESGDVVIKKFYGTREEVIYAIAGAVDATPIGPRVE